MLGRILQLFRRYARQHATITAAGFPLFDGTGGLNGHVDRVELRQGRLELAGWTKCERVTLVCDDFRAETRPDILRPDVSALHPDVPAARPVGFFLAAPYGQGPGIVICHDGSEHYVNRVPQFARGRRLRAELRQLPGFLARLVAGLPEILRWFLGRDLAARTAFKKRLGLDLVPTPAALNPGLFAAARASAPTAPAPAPGEITIILPVYNALELLKEALERIVAHTDLPWRLIVVEDCSTDPELRPYLQAWRARQQAAHRDRIEIIENARNLGFVGSVNAALERAIPLGNHVVLLNSDALVPPGWASRLLRPVLTHEAVASVTPMSNDAEILDVPVICQRVGLGPGEADRIDETARRFDPDACLAVLPTGVGFCMLMNIDYLRRVPAFDTAFGRGYGEEVDWCQKVRALGGRHIGHGGLFVEHRGGTSFGSAEKLRMIEANNAIISRRYPDYDAEVQHFIRTDPLSTPRLALAIAWAAARAAGPVPVFLAHSLGGGAESYLAHRLPKEIEAHGAAIVLRVGGRLRWRVECHAEPGIIAGETDDFDLVEVLLGPLRQRRIVYSCGVGDPDPIALPRLLGSLAGETDEIEILVHDFFTVSPSYCLLNAEGRFAGVPAAGDGDRAHRIRRPDGRTATLAQWRREWGRLMSRAARIVVFSDDSRQHVAAAYPDCAARIVVRPHALPHRIEPVTPVPSELPVIGVLGNINLPKGAEVLVRLNRELAASGRARLVLIGNIAPEYTLPPPAIVHGSYTPAEIAELARRYRISAWFIPSIWPETFSYTTHEALATGLPVACFDLGAQAEAVRRSATGRLIPLDGAGGDLRRVIEDILGEPA